MRRFAAEEITALLTPAEECALALTMEAGVLAQDALETRRTTVVATRDELRQLVREGEAARRRFTEANLGLARMVSHQLTIRSGAAHADVFQEACLGLLLAIRRFDCRRGFRFATYALFWIRAYASAATATAVGDLNLPASRAGQLRSVRGVEAALTQSLGRPATAREVAAAVDRPEHWVAELLAHRPARSLSTVPIELVDADLRRMDAPVDPGPGVGAVELLGRLGGLSRQVLELRLGFATSEPLSYAAVARRLQLPVGRVRRIEKSALEELRDICPYDAVEGW